MDGSGKTTLVDSLKTWFEEKGLKVKRDRLPHDRYIVSDLLNKSTDPYTDRLLFAVDNRMFGTELKEVLKSGEFDIVLTKDDLDSIERNDITKEDIDFINEIDNLFKTSKQIEIEERFRRFIKIEELN